MRPLTSAGEIKTTLANTKRPPNVTSSGTVGDGGLALSQHWVVFAWNTDNHAYRPWAHMYPLPLNVFVDHIFLEPYYVPRYSRSGGLRIFYAWTNSPENGPIIYFQSF